MSFNLVLTIFESILTGFFRVLDKSADKSKMADLRLRLFGNVTYFHIICCNDLILRTSRKQFGRAKHPPSFIVNCSMTL